MNIMWFVNVPLPEASRLLGERPVPFGGWLVNASACLAKNKRIKLSIAFPKHGLVDVQVLQGAKIIYYIFPTVKNSDYKMVNSNLFFKKMLNQVNPEIVHIFGTEYAQTLAMVNACNDQGITAVISIQGLVSVIAHHYLTGLPLKVQNQFTFRDIIRQDNIKQQQKKFIRSGRLEVKALQKVKHIIGRTTWDKACTFQINPNADYHFCNETLRNEFYKHIWDIDKCEKHSIFISNASYPIKGLHFMLEAMPIILKRYPATQLYIAGSDITKSDTVKDRLKMTSYGKYIKKLTKQFQLENNVIFTGLLDEKQMCERYLKSHVFVLSSSIENSPNAMSEAMLLGVPCVVSNVGGVADLLVHKKEGFIYQADASYMLAHYICEIFANDELSLQFSTKGRERALKTHNRETNLKTLLSIYKRILA